MIEKEIYMWVRNRYRGLGGGLYTGPDLEPYMSNWPPRKYLLEYMSKHNLKNYVDYMIKHGF